MAKAQSPSQIAFNDFLKTFISPLMKSKGFKKSGPNYFKKDGRASFVVNFQSSSGSSWQSKIFYINLGIAFDEVCIHRGLEVIDKPKEYECSDRGFSNRIECIYDDAPPCFTLSVVDGEQDWFHTVKDMLEKWGNGIEGISDLSSFRSSGLFNVIAKDQAMKALIYHMLGETSIALKEIDSLVAKFADRPTLSDKQYWLDHYNISI